ncbi:PRC-barrel domain-containing protein [Chelatococcus sambhunathii]|uniref:PRC-barrel domain-containing protein n=1 Tax=Chelatococcus sambhunathii TaxID=363953 RepID=A0ABU1DDN8_9HYPH|nr:PRC-barrel domain-containing protein [Chelatococcus sambhunathii]MDR4306202.1 PRC-barrel domain-containing protein [Chelatococcus sambhunathii]
MDDETADALLGKTVQSETGDDMGRVVDVIVDRGGAIRAAVIDFGGFLGVGTRKIAIDWRVLNFAKTKDKKSLVADLSPDQLRTAPAYKPGEPVVIVGRADVAPAAQPAPAAAAAPASPPAQDAPAPNR